MRIGLVCPYDMSRPGGVQSQVRDLARQLEAVGDEVVVIAPGLAGEARGLDLGKTISIPGNRSKVPLSVDPRVVRQIKTEASGLDLLHVHEPLMPVVSLSALRADTPVVGTFHAAPGTFGVGFYTVLKPQIQRLLGPNLRKLTAVSTTAAAPLPDGLDISIVPNGVDVSAFDIEAIRSPRRVAFLGRDEKRKGLDVLLEAWAHVSDVVPDSELVVMGADRGTEDITWMGIVDDSTKAGVLASSAICVAPNLGGESFGIVLVEGMAAGAAVVASDLPSFRDVGGDAVRFFETGASAGLAQALIDLLLEPVAIEDLSAAGRERATRFDWQVVTAQYREVYKEALS